MELPPVAVMLGLLSGFQLSQSLFAVAELDVATALVSGPRGVEDVAKEVGADPDALGRIIRFLAQHGVFRTKDGTIELTELGRTLADGPLRSVARYFRQTHYAPFGNLLDTVRTGEPAASIYYGKPFFDWVNEHPDMAALQNEAMAAFTQDARGDLLDVFDLPRGATVADTGGADGTLLTELLARYPDRRGILFDLPSVVPTEPPADRMEVVAGDFFDTVPTANVYVLSAVLQDWNNADSLRILRNIWKAGWPDARLVIIDMVVPESDEPHPTKSIDVTMLGMLGGCQRSESEWRQLLTDGGFALKRVVAGSGSYFALDATLTA
ncbi:methyltransferase [Kutzneria buriramensis]|uniref:AAA domain-containing protein n=1 Tax=Kutzneria buriramensis TaxID=1045776 RepID=A0A3E0HL31_9PSEU|nr:methyltransferase [Kutzneria buriramensis]REH47141.1 AAA domain-containing protein [Kutzneria buriramensis]